MLQVVQSKTAHESRFFYLFIYMSMDDVCA